MCIYTHTVHIFICIYIYIFAFSSVIYKNYDSNGWPQTMKSADNSPNQNMVKPPTTPEPDRMVHFFNVIVFALRASTLCLFWC